MSRTRCHPVGCLGLYLLARGESSRGYIQRGKFLVLPLHFLWIHCWQLVQKIEFAPRPFLQTPQGYLPCAVVRLLLTLHTMTLVLSMFTRRHFSSIRRFQARYLFSKWEIVLAAITRSSAYNNSQGSPVLWSWDRASRTIMKRTEPWWTPTFTAKLSLIVLFTLTALPLLRYITYIAFISHSSTPNFLMTHLK